MKQYERILVGLKSPEHVDELMDLACRMGGGKATIRLVHVIELPEPTPLDASVPDLEELAAEVLGKGKAIALEDGVQATTALLRSREAAPALLDEMRESGTDLAVLGFHHRRTFTELLLGTTAQHIARTAPCRIILSVPPRP